MPEGNVEVVRRMIDAFARGDMDESFGLMDPDIEWCPNMPDGEVWRGRDGVRSFFRSWLGTWEDYSFEQLELVEAGDKVVSVFREGGRGKGSGLEVDTEFAGIYVVRDGLVLSWTRYPSRAAAREAAGLPPG